MVTGKCSRNIWGERGNKAVCVWGGGIRYTVGVCTHLGLVEAEDICILVDLLLERLHSGGSIENGHSCTVNKGEDAGAEPAN